MSKLKRLETGMTDLNIRHCEEVMNQRLMIGSDEAKNGERKRFYFHVWLNEYQVEHGSHGSEKVIFSNRDSGQAIEELLEVYNSL